MTYTLVIPPNLLAKLAEFRDLFERSIRSQILAAIESYINNIEEQLKNMP